MSSGSVKEELLRCIDSARHCQIAELAAVLAFDGEIVRLGQGQIDLRVSSENESIVRKYFTLLQKTFTMNDSVSIDNRITKKNNRFLMELKDSQLAVKVLQAVKLLGADRMPQNLDALVNQMVVQRNCCKRAFIRGAFLCAGSISDPEKFYHFEIVCSSTAKAVQLQEMIQSFEVDAKIVKRKKYYVVYVKEGAQIVELLGLMGAGVSLMNLENVRIRRYAEHCKQNGQLRNSKYQQNCKCCCKADGGYYLYPGYRRSSQTAGKFGRNSAIRLEYPQASLKELGVLLSTPVGKSGMNHRLRKICSIAEELRGVKEEQI